MRLDPSTVLVTGATGGIGRALVDAFSAAGARLVLTGRRADALEAVAARCGGRAVVADLGDPADLERLCEEVEAVDVLVANAALPASGRIEGFDHEDLDRCIDVNLRAPIRLARAAVPAMLSRGRGHIVLVSSLAGVAATPESALYSATKFGLRGFGLALRQDLAGTGVGVSVVVPGFVRDAGMFADSGASLPPGVGTRSPEEVAAATLRAVERDRAEVAVAPAALTVGAYLAGAFPGPAAGAARLLGADRVAGAVASGQAGRRPGSGPSGSGR
ncbi:MAG: SDR family NAD(P)-dependent oxidoreductase [Actinomycetota bacterium]|nr:SDR family NAD(P)-dependent oxidoreductase [Actinomycetota bacterium]